LIPVEIKEQVEEEIPKTNQIQVKNLPAREDQPNCKACNEIFDQFYDDKKDDWMCRDVVDYDGSYYHQKCAQDVINNLTNIPMTYVSNNFNNISQLGNHLLSSIPLKRSATEMIDDPNPLKKTRTITFIS